jgi:hypothetical protein
MCGPPLLFPRGPTCDWHELSSVFRVISACRALGDTIPIGNTEDRTMIEWNKAICARKIGLEALSVKLE